MSATATAIAILVSLLALWPRSAELPAAPEPSPSPALTALASPTFTPTPTPTTTILPTPSATPASEDGDGPTSGLRTGIEDVDMVIDVLVGDDVDAIEALIRRVEVACAEEVEGLGGPPQCAEGEPDGTVWDAFPTAVCHGFYSRQSSREIAQGMNIEAAQLYGVVELPDRNEVGAWPAGEYGIVYAWEAETGGSFGSQIVVAEGRIVAHLYGCDTAEGYLTRGHPILFRGPAAQSAR